MKTTSDQNINQFTQYDSYKLKYGHKIVQAYIMHWEMGPFCYLLLVCMKMELLSQSTWFIISCKVFQSIPRLWSKM